MKTTTLAPWVLSITLASLPPVAAADSGFVVGGSIGASSFEDNISGIRVDTDTTAWRLTAGFQFTDLVGIEAGYHSFGKYDETFDVGGLGTDVSLRADGYTLGLTTALPLGGNFALFGRAGAFFWDADATIDNIVVEFPDETDYYYGLGADFGVNEQLSLLGDWTRYQFEGADSDVISIGFRYRF